VLTVKFVKIVSVFIYTSSHCRGTNENLQIEELFSLKKCSFLGWYATLGTGNVDPKMVGIPVFVVLT